MRTDDIDCHEDPRRIAIRDFPLDDQDAGLSFSRRLARENGWPKTFADGVIDEYRGSAALRCKTSINCYFRLKGSYWCN